MQKQKYLSYCLITLVCISFFSGILVAGVTADIQFTAATIPHNNYTWTTPAPSTTIPRNISTGTVHGTSTTNSPPVSTGTTYYVSTTGSDTSGTGSYSNPFRTITTAANKVVAGDTVCIRQGTYHEKVTLKNIQGTTASWITFQPYQTEKVILDATGLSGTYDGIFMLKDGCKYIRITGLELRNTKGHGVFLYGGEISNIHIDHCVIHDCESSGIYCFSASASTGKYVRTIEFNDNTVYWVNKGLSYDKSHSPQEAISFSNVQGFNIHHNILKLYGKEGIDCKSGSSNGQIHHNTITTSLDFPAFQWNYDHIGIYIDGYTRVGHDIQIYNNRITGYGGSGIVLNAEHPESGGAIKNINVYNNMINISYKTGYTQFRGIDSLNNAPWTNIALYHNTIRCVSGNHPLRVFPSATNIHNLVIQNNIFYGTAFSTFSFQYMKSTEVTNRVTMKNNLFFRTSGTTHNSWNDGTDKYWGSNSIIKNPQLKTDLHLSPTSPAIDKGITVSLSTDFDGDPRPVGNGYDIGADEYNPYATT